MHIMIYTADPRLADGTTFEFTANAQIWPRSLNSELGGDASKIYLITSDLGSNSGQGLDFISASPLLTCVSYRATD